MIKVYNKGAYLINGKEFIYEDNDSPNALNAKLGTAPTKEAATKGTMAYSILEAHNTSGNMEQLKIKFDAMASHDITYVGIIQTARVSGLEKFPIPYALTNCHNSLCAVGGTINEDDHMFGLTAAQKYGGIYVPAHQAVIHQYMREMLAGCGKMILGSDSHTRYGSLGTLAIGEGGPELVKQLLGKTYDLPRPEVVAVHIIGAPRAGVGPMDVAIALVKATFAEGSVKNRVLEFVGEGIKSLSAEYRIGIDVMTTETTCLSSIWETDDTIKKFLTVHGRPEEYRQLSPKAVAYYENVVEIDLSKVEPMIAMPYHPANGYTIKEFNSNLPDIINDIERVAKEQLGNKDIDLSFGSKIKSGKFYVDQAVIVGCAGGNFENIMAAADILEGYYVGSDKLALSVYASSQPVNHALTKNGTMLKLMESGAIIKTAFCGPCFGAGDVPANGALSIRHATRNFPSREGSKPGEGQISSVALMDARSIAATVRNGGALLPATELDINYSTPKYEFDENIYKNRCYNGFGRADNSIELQLGPNITDWPQMEPLAEDLVLKAVSVITDPVTTTDELIPSGETSSYRSNPLRLAEFTLSRKDPEYVGRAKEFQKLEKARVSSEKMPVDKELTDILETIKAIPQYTGLPAEKIGLGTIVYARKPGDGSAREQAASCQKVLGTYANMAQEYATKRYRSNLINWGMLPFVCTEPEAPVSVGDYVYVPNIKKAVEEKWDNIPAYVIANGTTKEISLTLQQLTDEERKIILAGCLMNYYRS